METIGFVGLGEMGVPMAASAVGAGWRVVGFDAERKQRRCSGNALDILYKDMRALMDEASSRRIQLPVAAVAFQRLLDEWKLDRAE